MSPTHVELYEALKPTLGEEAARMIAEVIPPTSDLATKLDIAATQLDIAAVKLDIAAVNERISTVAAEIRTEIKDAHVSDLRWMFGLFVPVWAGTWATVVAVLLKF